MINENLFKISIGIIILSILALIFFEIDRRKQRRNSLQNQNLFGTAGNPAVSSNSQ